MDRIWLALSGLSGLTAVIAGAVGAHAVTDAAALAVPVRIFDTAQLYHALHTVALLGVAVLLFASNDQRAGWTAWTLRLSALAFTLGIIGFSGGIYRQLLSGLPAGGIIVPIGGSCFIAGWLALTISAFGLRFAGPDNMQSERDYR